MNFLCYAKKNMAIYFDNLVQSYTIIFQYNMTKRTFSWSFFCKESEICEGNAIVPRKCLISMNWFNPK